MRIAQLPVSLPVLQVRSQITYQTPRRPTAIEHMILRLCTQLGGHPKLGGQPLVKHFESWLCVKDAALLVVPSLEDLLEIQVLENRSNVGLTDVAVRDLAITTRGHAMLQLGKLPGNPMHTEVGHLYDPIGGALKLMPPGKRPSGLSENPNAAHAESAAFEALDPSPIVREKLPVEKHGWLGAGTVVDDVTCAVGEDVLWRERVAEIEADPQTGTLRASVPGDPAAEKWLRGLDGDVAWDQMLSHAFDGDSEAAEDGNVLPTLSLAGAQAAEPSRNLPELLQVGMRAAVCVTLGAMKADEPQPGKGTIRVFLEPGRRAPQLEWNPSCDGARVRLPMPEIPSGLVAWWIPAIGKPAVSWSLGRVPTQWAGSRLLLTLAVRAADAEAAQLGPRLLSALGQAAEQCDPLGSSLFALWEPIERVIERSIARITGTLRERAEAAAAFRTRIEAVAGTKIPAPLWDARVRPVLEAAIHAMPAKLPASALPDAVRSLRDAGLRAPAPLVALLFARVAAAANLKELRAIQAACGPGVELPKAVFSPVIVRALVEDAFAPGSPNRGSSPVENATHKARTALDALISHLKADPARLDDEDACQAVLPGLRKSVLETLATWRLAATELRQFVIDPAILDNTRFARVESGLARLQQFLGRLADLDPSVGRPIVIDTNALIDHPDLVSLLERDEVPVLPKRVLDELDAKKRDPTIGANVTRAIGSIRAAGERIRYIAGDMDLLPPDFRMSGDNLILSVAMRLMVLDPLLLTADKNLQNKAQAQRLRFEEPRAFVAARSKRASSPSSKSTQSAHRHA